MGKRKYFRRKLSVEIDHFDLDDQYHLHFSRNLSRGGVFIETDSPLAVGSKFLMHFEIPGDFPRPIETEGEVAWVLRIEDSTADLPPGMGVRFTDLGEEDAASIDTFLLQEGNGR